MRVEENQTIHLIKIEDHTKTLEALSSKVHTLRADLSSAQASIIALEHHNTETFTDMCVGLEELATDIMSFKNKMTEKLSETKPAAL